MEDTQPEGNAPEPAPEGNEPEPSTSGGQNPKQKSNRKYMKTFACSLYLTEQSLGNLIKRFRRDEKQYIELLGKTRTMFQNTFDDSLFGYCLLLTAGFSELVGFHRKYLNRLLGDIDPQHENYKDMDACRINSACAVKILEFFAETMDKFQKYYFPYYLRELRSKEVWRRMKENGLLDRTLKDERAMLEQNDIDPNKYLMEDLICLPDKRMKEYMALLLKILSLQTFTGVNLDERFNAFEKNLYTCFKQVQDDTQEMRKLEILQNKIDGFPPFLPNMWDEKRHRNQLREYGHLLGHGLAKAGSDEYVFVLENLVLTCRRKDDGRFDYLSALPLTALHEGDKIEKKGKAALNWIPQVNRDARDHMYAMDPYLVDAFEKAIAVTWPCHKNELGHKFELHTSLKPIKCSNCGHFIGGAFFQGYKCNTNLRRNQNAQCHQGYAYAHRECLKKVPKCSFAGPDTAFAVHRKPRDLTLYPWYSTHTEQMSAAQFQEFPVGTYMVRHSHERGYSLHFKDREGQAAIRIPIAKDENDMYHIPRESDEMTLSFCSIPRLVEFYENNYLEVDDVKFPAGVNTLFMPYNHARLHVLMKNGTDLFYEWLPEQLNEEEKAALGMAYLPKLDAQQRERLQQLLQHQHQQELDQQQAQQDREKKRRQEERRRFEIDQQEKIRQQEEQRLRQLRQDVQDVTVHQQQQQQQRRQEEDDDDLYS